jgi:RimJ/RimL family protein N-acetyltransferase
MPRVATKRLVLDRMILSDAAALFEYRSDPSVSSQLSWVPSSLDEVSTFITSYDSRAFDEPDTWFQLAVRGGDSGVLVGDLGVHFLADDSNQVEIGYTIAPAQQKKGYGGEAVAGLVGHLFETMGKHRVIASVDPRNSPSIALLKRVGFRQEAHFRESLWFKGAWVDDVVFALLRLEWEGNWCFSD